VYAIAFDMDIEALRANYGDPYNNAYLEIRPPGTGLAAAGKRPGSDKRSKTAALPIHEEIRCRPRICRRVRRCYRVLRSSSRT
jgi:hypothetical protein